MYKEIISPQIEGIKLHKVIMEYCLFPARKGVDRNNFLTVIDKFFMDALVSKKCLKNDTNEFVIETKFSGSFVDTKNPRCEITIIDI